MGTLKTLGNLAKERHHRSRLNILAFFAKLYARTTIETLEPQPVQLEAGWDDDL